MQPAQLSHSEQDEQVLQANICHSSMSRRCMPWQIGRVRLMTHAHICT